MVAKDLPTLREKHRSGSPVVVPTRTGAADRIVPLVIGDQIPSPTVAVEERKKKRQRPQRDRRASARSHTAIKAEPRSHRGVSASRAEDELLPMRAMLEDALIDAAGILLARGWAVSQTSIEQIAVFLDDRLLGLAEGSLSRPDIGRAFPNYPNSDMGGFRFRRELVDSNLTGRTVRVAVLAAGGIAVEVSASLNVRQTRQQDATDDGAIHSHCDELQLSEHGTLLVHGWAVCPSGVEAVAIDVDDTFVGLAETGRDRPDVGSRFPSVSNGRKAGFRFAGNLGAPYDGTHVVQITIRGRDGELQTIRHPVRAVAEPAPDTACENAIKLMLDLPVVTAGVAVEPVRGSMVLGGWATSENGIAGVEVLIDGTSLGDTRYGIRREDVYSNFPDMPDSMLSGFAMLVPQQSLKQGTRLVRVVARDKAGLIGEQEFSVAVDTAPESAGPWTVRRKMPLAEIDLDLAILAATRCRPRFELLLSIDRLAAGTIRRLRRTLDSLHDQAHGDWRLTIVSPTPISPEQLGAGFQSIAAKVRLTPDPAPIDRNVLAGRPQLICMLIAGDELGEDALIELAIARAEQQDGDFFYSDERRRDPSDGMIKAFFKPDWSPDLLLSTNYIGRLWAVVPTLLDRAGIGFDELHRFGAYDVVLRLTEHARRIVHVPKVLCASAEREGVRQQRRALERALIRRGVAAQVQRGCLPGTFRVKRAIKGHPLVSIIIPTMAARGLVKIALESIRSKTSYENYEIVCLDNIPADDIASKDYVRRHADLVVEIAEPFNWSRINNRGAKHARGEFLLFLNDDIEVLDAEWLTSLVEQGQRQEVGVVGARLLYPDGKVQHAGMFLSCSVARHAFRFSPSNAPGPFGLALSQRNVISVTGACMLISRAAFEKLGGFDERHAIINNDLDYCLRARQDGQLVVFVPQANLIHHEMASRSAIKDIYNKKRFGTAWRDLFLAGDPYFSPHLNVDCDEYTPEAEPVRVLHVGHPLIDKQRVRRILAVKLDHIGDFVAAIPSFRRLKRHFPQAELWVLAATASLSLARLEPAIDKVIEFNFFHRVSGRGARAVTKSELRRLRRQLEPLGFDLAIDLRRHLETRPVLQVAGARWTAGFDHRGAASWLDIAVEWEGDTARNSKRLHVSDSLLQLVDAVAEACTGDRTVVAAGPSAVEARTLASALPAVAPIAAALFARRAVCVHAGVGAENRRWPVASFAGLIDLLTSRDGVNVVLIGSPDEARLAKQLIASVRHKDRLFSLVGKVQLGDLPTVLRACDLFVGNDSGPKHLASALGVATVGIHSGSVDAVEWGPVGPAAVAVRRDMICSPCYLAKVADCPRGLACLQGIAVGDVYRVCRRMLSLSA